MISSPAEVISSIQCQLLNLEIISHATAYNTISNDHCFLETVIGDVLVSNSLFSIMLSSNVS